MMTKKRCACICTVIIFALLSALVGVMIHDLGSDIGTLKAAYVTIVTFIATPAFTWWLGYLIGGNND